MLKALLQGKPFRHPVHPALVHFPIGLFILSLILDIVSYMGVASNDLPRASRYAMGFGLAIGLLAALTGLLDRSDIRLDHPARKTSTIHMILNFTALALFGINFFLNGAIAWATFRAAESVPFQGASSIVGDTIVLQLHLFNTTENPMIGTSGIEIIEVDAAEVVNEANIFLPGPFGFSIPPDPTSSRTRSSGTRSREKSSTTCISSARATSRRTP